MRPLLLCFLTLLVGCMQMPPSFPDLNKLDSATVALVTEASEDDPSRIYCSGTWVSEDEILTANHCVSNELLDALGLSAVGEEILYKTEKGEPERAVVRLTNTKWDLALVKVFKAPKHAVAKVGPEPLRGQRVFTVGHPLGLGWSYIPGYVSAIRDDDAFGRGAIKVLQLDSDMAPGDSGAGVFDFDGQLVGVVSYGSRRFPIHFAIDRDLISDFLKGAK